MPGFVLTNLFPFTEALTTQIEVVTDEGRLGEDLSPEVGGNILAMSASDPDSI
jgi:hypothetical protein